MKSIIAHIACFLTCLNVFGQLSFHHNQSIQHIFIDSSSNVAFIDNQNRLFHLDNLKILPFKNNNKKIRTKPTLIEENIIIIDNKLRKIQGHQLVDESRHPNTIFISNESVLEQSGNTINFINKNELICSANILQNIEDAIITNENAIVITKDTLYDVCRSQKMNLNFEASSIIILDDTSILISSQNSGLWLNKNQTLRKYYISGITFPNNIKRVKHLNNSLWILTTDKTLLNFNIDKQILKRVAVDVQDFGLDFWEKLWYASKKSLISNIDYINDKFPQLDINKVAVNGEKLSTENRVSVTQSDELKIYYSVHYSPHKDLVIEYRLNSNQAWQKAKQSPILLNDIDVSSKVFQIRSSADHVYFSKPKSFQIDVRKELMGTHWFYIILCLLGLLLLLLFSQWRISRQNKILEIERKSLKLELEIIKKEQKLGQLQLNPHFIFNTMNSINGLIAMDRKSEARKALTKFATMMRSVLSFSFDEKIAASKEMAFIKDYLLLEQLIREDTFEFSIENNIQDYSLPPMIIQPFVENAILHGLQHKKGKGHLKIILEDIPKYIKVQIIDDGIGREAAEKYRKETHDSSAVKIVKDRLLKLDKWKIEKPITYIDIKEGSIPKGTNCILHIPK